MTDFMHNFVHLQLENETQCVLSSDSSDFHILYPFSILRLSVHMSSSVWPFPFPPVCHPHCLELHPSLLVSRQSLSPLLFSLKAARALCCLRSLSAAMPHSFLWISFIHYASLQIFSSSFFSLSRWSATQMGARFKLIGIPDEPITRVRTCWGLLFLLRQLCDLCEQDPSPKLVITPLRWAINHLSVTFQFIFSLNSCSYLELKTSISLTVEELRVTANHCDCLLFEEAQMNSWASLVEQLLTDSDYILSESRSSTCPHLPRGTHV